MTEPRIVSPQEAQAESAAWANTAGRLLSLDDALARDYSHTVATEPDRIAQAERRGAVKALRGAADWFVARNTYGPLSASDQLLDRAAAIENGAPL